MKSMMSEGGQTGSVKNQALTGNAISHRRTHHQCGMNYLTLTSAHRSGSVHKDRVVCRTSFVWVTCSWKGSVYFLCCDLIHILRSLALLMYATFHKNTLVN